MPSKLTLLRDDLPSVARQITKPSPPPEWLLVILRHFAPLIRSNTDRIHDQTVEQGLFDSAEYLIRWLPMFVEIKDRFLLPVPTDTIDSVTSGLEELLPFLASQIDPTPPHRDHDHSRALCAQVCTEIWRRVHGRSIPYSDRLWSVCEAYWQACGKPPTSRSARLKNWESMCVKAARLAPPTDWFEEIIDHPITPSK